MSAGRTRHMGGERDETGKNLALLHFISTELFHETTEVKVSSDNNNNIIIININIGV